MLENSRTLSGFHLPREMENHAGGHAFVRLARLVNIEVTEADDDPVLFLGRGPIRQIIHDGFRERVNVRGRGAVCFHAGRAGGAIGGGGGGVDHARLVRLREIQEAAEALHVVVGLDELIVQGRVGDRGEMKDRLEFFVAELLLPIERRQILRHEIACIAGEVLEIAGAEIIDHGQLGIWHCSWRARTRLEPIKPAPPVMRKFREAICIVSGVRRGGRTSSGPAAETVAPTALKDSRPYT